MKYSKFPHWGSHLPVLARVTRVTDGPVLELGVGVFSTPFLHWMCIEGKRSLVSYESNEAYYKMHKWFEGELHQVNFVEDWDDVKIEKPWDVAFVDHNTERRRIEIKRLAAFAKYVVIHDTQPKPRAVKSYGYDKIYPLFKHRRDFTFAGNWTSVVSNFEDLSAL